MIIGIFHFLHQLFPLSWRIISFSLVPQNISFLYTCPVEGTLPTHKDPADSFWTEILHFYLYHLPFCRSSMEWLPSSVLGSAQRSISVLPFGSTSRRIVTLHPSKPMWILPNKKYSFSLFILTLYLGNTIPG